MIQNQKLPGYELNLTSSELHQGCIAHLLHSALLKKGLNQADVY